MPTRHHAEHAPRPQPSVPFARRSNCRCTIQSRISRPTIRGTEPSGRPYRVRGRFVVRQGSDRHRDDAGCRLLPVGLWRSKVRGRRWCHRGAALEREGGGSCTRVPPRFWRKSPLSKPGSRMCATRCCRPRTVSQAVSACLCWSIGNMVGASPPARGSRRRRCTPARIRFVRSATVPLRCSALCGSRNGRSPCCIANTTRAAAPVSVLPGRRTRRHRLIWLSKNLDPNSWRT